MCRGAVFLSEQFVENRLSFGLLNFNMNAITTNGITVSVRTQFLPEHSNPAAQKFIFGYLISIENGSPYTVQLLRRHWLIFDSKGIVREVEGEGVVGEQPVIPPGGQHEYTSFCDLGSEMGKMRGTYLMVRQGDDYHFKVNIPEFSMVAPQKLN